MTVLAMIVIITWVWMLATSLHLDDLKTDARRPSTLVRRPAQAEVVPDSRRASLGEGGLSAG